MILERATAKLVRRPWGVFDLGDWSERATQQSAVGEIWFDRSASADSRLLLKLLFSCRPLSIQVHPDDAYAKSKGLRNGKTEAWYVLAANSDAKVAVGLKRSVDLDVLRRAALDGSLNELVNWRNVAAGDCISVPAGTIHAIGAGLIIAEIQQRSEATYRLFDYGSDRELHVDDAIAVAHAAPSTLLSQPIEFSSERRVLVASPFFVMERVELPADTVWRLDVDSETWLLGLSGRLTVNSLDTAIELAQGQAIFVQSDAASDCVDIRVGAKGGVALVAYAQGAPQSNLLQRSRQGVAQRAGPERLPTPNSVVAQPTPNDRHLGSTP